MPDVGDLERRATELLQRLIRFRTVNPPGGERDCQEYLHGMLEGEGFEVELLEVAPGRPNLVARLPAPSGADGPTLCLLGHVDTVLANPDDWDVDPWSGALRDDGCVWGRGALDMKSQVAAEVAAAGALAGAGWRPAHGELKIVLTVDEEAGAVFGAQWLCEHHPDKVRADIVVNEGAGVSFEWPAPASDPDAPASIAATADPATPGPRRIYPVCVAEKGVFRFTLSARGEAGHASIPRIGSNALAKLAPAIGALCGAPVVPEHSPEADAFLEALGVQTDDLVAAIAEVEATDSRVAVLLEPLLGVTFAPTMVSASDKINVIPAEAHVRVDCRVPPGKGQERALTAIRAAIAGEPVEHSALNPLDPEDTDFYRDAAHRALGYDVRLDETVVGNRSPIDTPLMDSIRSFVEREDPGAVVTPTALAGFSDSRWFREAFPDCVAYGFFPMRSMDLFEAAPLVHGANERIPVEDLTLATRFYADLIERTLG
ncbi:MAG: M20/M25/M40 family metallo-hydrolase [Thermoleophilaceae bacterium]